MQMVPRSFQLTCLKALVLPQLHLFCSIDQYCNISAQWLQVFCLVANHKFSKLVGHKVFKLCVRFFYLLLRLFNFNSSTARSSWVRVHFLLRKIFRRNLNEAISTKEITSFRFPQEISLKRKLIIQLKEIIQLTSFKNHFIKILRNKVALIKTLFWLIRNHLDWRTF